MTSPADPKPALRSQARARRDSLSPEARISASTIIANRALVLIGQAEPSVVACYSPIRSEVDCTAIVAWSDANGVAVVLPSVEDGDEIVFRRHRPGEPLVDNAVGTRAPHISAPEVDPDLVILPMVAFDRRGHRLGYGRGFYDRAISRLRSRGKRPLLLGIAFAVQEVPAIPSESHDVRMDWVVTEKETLDFRGFD